MESDNVHDLFVFANKLARDPKNREEVYISLIGTIIDDRSLSINLILMNNLCFLADMFSETLIFKEGHLKMTQSKEMRDIVSKNISPSGLCQYIIDDDLEGFLGHLVEIPIDVITYTELAKEAVKYDRAEMLDFILSNCVLKPDDIIDLYSSAKSEQTKIILRKFDPELVLKNETTSNVDLETNNVNVDFEDFDIFQETKNKKNVTFQFPKSTFEFDMGIVIDQYINSIENHRDNVFLQMFDHHELRNLKEHALNIACNANNIFAIDRFSKQEDYERSSVDVNKLIKEAYIKNDLETIRYTFMKCDFSVIYDLFLQSIRHGRHSVMDLFMKVECFDMWKQDMIDYAECYNTKAYKILKQYYFSTSKPSFNKDVIIDYYFSAIRDHNDDLFDAMYQHHELSCLQTQALNIAAQVNNHYVFEVLRNYQAKTVPVDYNYTLLIDGYRKNNIKIIKRTYLQCNLKINYDLFLRSIRENKLDVLNVFIETKLFDPWRPDMIDYAESLNHQEARMLLIRGQPKSEKVQYYDALVENAYIEDDSKCVEINAKHCSFETLQVLYLRSISDNKLDMLEILMKMDCMKVFRNEMLSVAQSCNEEAYLKLKKHYDIEDL